MKFKITLFFFLCTFFTYFPGLPGQSKPVENLLPVRGFCIAAPGTEDLDRFIKFIDEELAPRRVNNLVLRVDYNYRYLSHPELQDPDALSREDVKRIVAICKKNGISLVPQVNLLGHQSWANRTNNLLKVYPQFDETPLVKMPEKYEWPNPDKLYCKSYCPLHPDVHNIVFALMDEICDVYEADAFHAGMDEVFYIGESQCPKCKGKDKAELFAGEVIAIHDHLAQNGRRLWIWGDRLIDGKISGIGEWEGSYNETYGAVDLIPKDVMICDWHYERPEPTPVYFAMQGFDVITCPWRDSQNAVQQAKDMLRFRKNSNPVMSEHFQGMMQTVWSGAGQFLDSFYDTDTDSQAKTPANCFRSLYLEIQSPEEGE